MKAAMFGMALLLAVPAQAQGAKIVKTDIQIDALDPGIKLFVREKMAEGNTRFTDDNIVLFVHGATFPSTCDFDLQYKDYSWADWLVKHGYVVYMGDKRNYGFSTREKAMDEPAAKNQPVTRSYLAIRDIDAMVDHIKAQATSQKVTLIGWSWGAMIAGYYASLHSREGPQARPLRAALQLQRPHQPRAGHGCRTSASRASSTPRSAPTGWRGGGQQGALGRRDPVANKDEYREPGVRTPSTRLPRHRPDQQHAQPAGAARAQWRAGGFVLPGDRPADVERGRHLRADAGDRRRLRYLVFPPIAKA